MLLHKLSFMILSLVIAVSGCSQPEAPEDVDQRPNILLVMADDMGWTDLGRFGSEIETPNLDALAARGVTFSDFHTSVSCSPTRSMLMSGTDNHIAGLGNMAELLTPEQEGQPGYEGHLNERVVSLAEVLRADGYHTYMAGKWHLGHHEGTRPHDRGFDQTLTMLPGGASHYADMLGIVPRDDPAEYSSNGRSLESLPDDFYSSKSYADFLIEHIRSTAGDGNPWFGYLAFTAPHDPVQVPEPWLSKYSGRYDDGYDALKVARWEGAKQAGVVPDGAVMPGRHPITKPWDELTDDEKALESRGMEVYAGMVEALDHHYGRVIQFLDEIGELDNTIVIFLSDNGANPWYSSEYPGATEPDFAGQFDNSLENIGKPRSNYAYGMGFATGSGGPVDLFKMTVGEGGIRVPLIVAGPGVQSGRQVDAFAYVWDLMPTVLEFTGSSHPETFEGHPIEGIRGRTLSGLLSGSATEVYSDDDLIGGEMGGGKWMRQGALKAVSVPKPYGDGEWHLYNVVDDPGETNDLAGQQPEKLEALRAVWGQYAEDVGVIP
jgi:arylsulfatase A-like enzyme